MAEFKDAKGDRWQVAVTGGTIKRALDLLKVDLGQPLAGKPPLLSRFDIDIAFKVDLLYVVCMPQADEREISDLQFAERLEGDSLYAASQALLAAWADFFRRGLRQEATARAIEKEQEALRAVFEVASQTLASEEFEGATARELARLKSKLKRSLNRLGRSAASSRRSPGPTPRSEPSAS